MHSVNSEYAAMGKFMNNNFSSLNNKYDCCT